MVMVIGACEAVRVGGVAARDGEGRKGAEERNERGQQTGTRQQPGTHSDTSKGSEQVGRTEFILTCGRCEVIMPVEKFAGCGRYNRNHAVGAGRNCRRRGAASGTRWASAPDKKWEPCPLWSFPA